MDVNRIRTDFPALEQRFNGKPVVYLDSACMTMKPRQVIRALMDYYEQYPSCGGRSVHRFGTKVSIAVEESRERVARFIGAAAPREIVFTRNTTEGINLIARTLPLGKGDVVVTSDREHNSNLVPWLIAVQERGVVHETVPSAPDSTFDIERYKEVLARHRGRVRLVSMVHTSNLDGCTLPAGEIASIAHDAGALALFDGAQAAPHRSVDVRRIGADFYCFSVHKMLGPTGVGVLYGKMEHMERLPPFIAGGNTVETTHYTSFKLLPPPERFEAGLQDYAGIAAVSAAVDYLERLGMDAVAGHETSLNRRITDGLSGIPGFSLIGPPEPERRGPIVSFNIRSIDPHDIAIILDDTANIFIRSGMHCVHSWFNARGIRGSARPSVYIYNTVEEADLFAESVRAIAAKLGR